MSVQNITNSDKIYACHKPVVGRLPLVFDSPHSGMHYPDDFRYTAPFSLLKHSEDMYVEELYNAAPGLGATLLEALFPRCYIDPNRSIEDIDQRLLSAPWPGPIATGQKTNLGKSLIWRLAKTGVPIYDRKLGIDEVQGRIDRYYKPYHDALDATADELHREFGGVWHLNCHSMPSVGDNTSIDEGCLRADFVLGDRDGTTCSNAFTSLVFNTITSLGYSVALNDPFKGVEIVRRHGRKDENRHSLQIEISRRLYMDETTFEKTVGFYKLQADITELVNVICDFVHSELATLKKGVT